MNIAPLEIADNTVDTFLKRAEKKLNAKTPAHAVAKAMRAMLIGQATIRLNLACAQSDLAARQGDLREH